jgi:acetyl esterase/lipase
MTMRCLCSFLLTRIIATIGVLHCSAQAQDDPTFGYNLELDIVYAQGRIASNGTETLRDLMMDVYSPTEVGEKPWPAVVYVHGGAFHRGGRRKPPYKLGAAIHSSPEDWARLLVANGYKVFVIEYRLAPQIPITGYVAGADHTVSDIRSVISEQMMTGFSRARTGLGLPPLGYDDIALDLIWNAYMSGVEDAMAAVSYIVDHSMELNIDPDSIAMGGHSAGAGITTSVGLGVVDAPLKAIFPMSAPDIFFDWNYVIARDDLPAVLLHFSQYDDSSILIRAPGMISMLRRAENDFTLGWIPGFMHFYPYNAPSLADDGSRMALGDRVIAFLDTHLKN